MEIALNEKKVVVSLTIGAILLMVAISFIPMLITTDVGLGLSTSSAAWAASQGDVVGAVLGIAGYWAAVATAAVVATLAGPALILFL
ncbi:MAG: hypothetical protein WBI44_11340 [Syntrophaceticus sp.]